MRFHVVSLPHTITSKEFSPCAYTQKVFNFCRMMKSLGHTVYHYGGEGSTPDCDEHITVITAAQRERWWGANNWRKEMFAIEWDSNLDYWKAANSMAIAQIQQRIEQKDFICLIGGNCHKPIADFFPAHQSVEFGVGYKGIFSKFCVFESSAWMHHVYGRNQMECGRYYDTVIPNYYDPADFPDPDGQKEDYCLFVGRIIHAKGAHIAAEVCRKIGMKLKVAGQGALEVGDGFIKGDGVHMTGDIEYCGVVDPAQRAQLMSRARAVFVPTQYIGPFEGVHVEAMLCGTPVITTDWGVFRETVINGFNGYRTRDFHEMCRAVDDCRGLDPQLIREYAINHFSIDNVRYQYQEYFEHLLRLWDSGWYEDRSSPA